MKVLWIDTETTGLNPIENGVHQVAGLVELSVLDKNNPLIQFDINANPLQDCQVSSWYDKNKNCEIDALSISGKTKDDLSSYQSYESGMQELIATLSGHINLEDKTDKFILAGYNVGFDKDMLFGWAKVVGEKYLGKYIDHRVIDVMTLARTAYALGLMLEPKDFKLETMAEKYGIAIDAHDASSDIEATRKLFFVLIGLIRGEDSQCLTK
jgi:DNA polymerase-3 subunit epsilon